MLLTTHLIVTFIVNQACGSLWSTQIFIHSCDVHHAFRGVLHLDVLVTARLHGHLEHEVIQLPGRHLHQAIHLNTSEHREAAAKQRTYCPEEHRICRKTSCLWLTEHQSMEIIERNESFRRCSLNLKHRFSELTDTQNHEKSIGIVHLGIITFILIVKSNCDMAFVNINYIVNNSKQTCFAIKK